MRRILTSFAIMKPTFETFLQYIRESILEITIILFDRWLYTIRETLRRIRRILYEYRISFLIRVTTFLEDLRSYISYYERVKYLLSEDIYFYEFGTLFYDLEMFMILI